MRFSFYITILISIIIFSGCNNKKGNHCDIPDQPNFSLIDLNPSSETYGESIGPQFFNDKVSLFYFPYSETWGTCQNRFGSLNSLYYDYGGINSDLRIVGVGKNNDAAIDEIIENRILPYVKDDETQNVWNSWCPDDRDLIFLDRDGSYFTKINLDTEFPEVNIRDIIDSLLDS